MGVHRWWPRHAGLPSVVHAWAQARVSPLVSWHLLDRVFYGSNDRVHTLVYIVHGEKLVFIAVYHVFYVIERPCTIHARIEWQSMFQGDVRVYLGLDLGIAT